VERAAGEIVEMGERSVALFGARAAALSDLTALAAECGQADWDGQGAALLDPGAVWLAKRFVRMLPEGLPLPEFAPEPDGAISLDWIHSRHRLLSVSIGPSDRLAYAWLNGTDQEHGVARFDGQRIPWKILQNIGDVMGLEHAGLRAA
jgi:hypothetical protein